MRILFAIVCAGVLLGAEARAVDGYISWGYGKGGTNLSQLTGGQDYSLNAGAAFFVSGGAIFPVGGKTEPHRFELQTGIGYQFTDDPKGGDKAPDDVSWQRVPIDVIYFYHNTRNEFRFGYGLTYHFANELSAKGANASAQASVNPSLGTVLTLEKVFEVADGSAFTIGIRYNMIRYSSANFTDSANGNALYLTMGAIGNILNQ